VKMQVFVADLGRSLGLPPDTDEATIRATLDEQARIADARDRAEDRMDHFALRYFPELERPTLDRIEARHAQGAASMLDPSVEWLIAARSSSGASPGY
jgi:hypothetical protein